MSTEKKRVKVKDKPSVDLPWCCDTLCTYDKHMHSLDCGRKENMRKRDNLCLASMLAANDSSSAQAMGSCDSGGESEMCVLE